MSALLKAPHIDGAKIGVVLENKFIPEEIAAYLSGFPLLGAQVELISRLWYGDYKPAVTTFYSDVDPSDDPVWASPQKIDVRRDISQVRPADFDAVIMAANYTSVRLRFPGELPDDLAQFDAWEHVQSAPVVRFFAEAMQQKRLVKGLLCHGLWVLTPNPKLLRGRKVICHSVVMADIINCGAQIVVTPERVVTDDDLVTGFSKHQVLPFIAAIATQVSALKTGARAGELVPLNPYA
jgi:protease I